MGNENMNGMFLFSITNFQKLKKKDINFAKLSYRVLLEKRKRFTAGTKVSFAKIILL